MALTDDARTDLHHYLRETMGEERAGTLMAYLPPVGWADVATKHDLDHLRLATKADLADVRAELKAEIADLRTELRIGLADVRTELRTGLADVRTEFHRALRTTVLTLVATNITLFGLAVATVRLA